MDKTNKSVEGGGENVILGEEDGVTCDHFARSRTVTRTPPSVAKVRGSALTSEQLEEKKVENKGSALRNSRAISRVTEKVATAEKVPLQPKQVPTPVTSKESQKEPSTNIMALVRQQMEQITSLEKTLLAIASALPKNAPMPVKEGMKVAKEILGGIKSARKALTFEEGKLQKQQPVKQRNVATPVRRIASFQPAAIEEQTGKRGASSTPEGRIEAKRGRTLDHKLLKIYSKCITSRLNIPLTFSKKACLNFSQFLVEHKRGIEEKHIFFKESIFVTLENTAVYEECDAVEGTYKNTIQIQYNGLFDKKNHYLCSYFGTILQIFKIISFYIQGANCFVCCHPIKIKNFDYHFQSYEIGKSE